MKGLANSIIQECLKGGESWHQGVFALFLFALLVQYMAFLHAGWTCTAMLRFGSALLHAVIDEISLSLFSARAVLMQASENLCPTVIMCNLGCMTLLHPKIVPAS